MKRFFPIRLGGDGCFHFSLSLKFYTRRKNQNYPSTFHTKIHQAASLNDRIRRTLDNVSNYKINL